MNKEVKGVTFALLLPSPEPYRYGSGDGSNRANVTPLTSLFTTYLTDQLDDGLDAGISVSEGCATTANNIGTAIESRVNEVMTSSLHLPLIQ